MSYVSQIIRLIDTAADKADRSPHTVGRWVSGDGRTYARLRAGHDITIRRATCIMQRLSDLWPAAAEWPSDIPRPTPDGDSEPPAGGAGSVPPVPPPAPAEAGVPARGSLSIAPPASLKRAETSRPPSLDSYPGISHLSRYIPDPNTFVPAHRARSAGDGAHVARAGRFLCNPRASAPAPPHLRTP